MQFRLDNFSGKPSHEDARDLRGRAHRRLRISFDNEVAADGQAKYVPHGLRIVGHSDYAAM